MRSAGASHGMDEWSFAIDQSTGNVYFYNRRTRETRWTLPSEHVGSSLISSLSTAHSVLKQVQREEEKIVFEKENESEVSMSIKEAVDPATGKTYYYDTKTRVSYWEDPRVRSKRAAKEEEKRSKSPEHIDQLVSSEEEQESKVETTGNATVEASAENDAGDEPENDARERQEKTQVDSFVDEDEILIPEPRLVKREPSRTTFVDEEEILIPEPRLVKREPSLTSESTFSQRMLQSTSIESFQKQSISSTLSGESRSSSAAYVRHHIQQSQSFNKDDLRLLKAKLASKNLNSSNRSTPTIKREQRQLHLPSVSHLASGSPPRSVSRQNQQRSPQKQPTRNVPSTSTTICLRKSGCPCSACAAGDSPMPIRGSAEILEVDDRVACGSCGRKFVVKSLAVHERVCEKVFRNKQQTSPSPQAPEPRKSVTPSTSSGMSKWRKQSQELRMAMSRGRWQQPVQHSQPIGNHEDSFMNNEDDGLIQCPHCERRFSEKAAERHIPKCNDIRSKPKTLRKGEGRAVHSANLNLSSVESPIPTKTPRSSIGGGGGRKSLNSSTLSERGTSTSPCPHCRRQFSTKVLERHLDVCASQRRHRLSTVAYSHIGRRAGLLTSPSSQSESSWDGGEEIL